MKALPLMGLLAVTGCASLPPAPPARPDTQVQSPFGKTWDAVVDYFARSSIPVKTIDRTSGLIAAETTQLSGDNSAYARCSNGFLNFAPSGASFNALIKGDSARSTVRVTANWLGAQTEGSARVMCVTTDVWEKQFETAIKAKAEAP